MPWPLSPAYNEAIQSPAGNFADPDLQRGLAVCNDLGLPAPYSGNFADVYQVRWRFTTADARVRPRHRRPVLA